MASLTGTAHNSQDLWDLSKRALIQGGGSTTINLFESTNARGATDGIFFYSRGTESGPGEAILGAAQGDDKPPPPWLGWLIGAEFLGAERLVGVVIKARSAWLGWQCTGARWTALTRYNWGYYLLE